MLLSSSLGFKLHPQKFNYSKKKIKFIIKMQLPLASAYVQWMKMDSYTNWTLRNLEMLEVKKQNL